MGALVGRLGGIRGSLWGLISDCDGCEPPFPHLDISPCHTPLAYHKLNIMVGCELEVLHNNWFDSCWCYFGVHLKWIVQYLV